jgi:hypothetical protein
MMGSGAVVEINVSSTSLFDPKRPKAYRPKAAPSLPDSNVPNRGHNLISPASVKSIILSGPVGYELLSGGLCDFILEKNYKAEALIKSLRKTLSP